ncbi:MAG: FMN-dependent NADH-azoreductase [Chthoniobacterales bacterium]
MSRLLVVNSSARGEGSVSRSLVKEFLSLRVKNHPEEEVTQRDVSKEPLPIVTESWIIGAYAPEEHQTVETKAAIAVSDALVDEFLAADRYVFGVPIYNLNVPAAFKAYIDQIVRVRKTFGVGPNGYEGLVKGRKALVIAAYGGVFSPGSPYAAYNFHEPYLRAIFGFIGVTDIQFIVADGQNIGDEAAAASKAKAQVEIKALAANW